MRAEARLAGEAAEAFKTSNYPKAAESYEKLLAEYPTSTDREKYDFFNDLSVLHNLVGSVTFRESPSGGLSRYREFLNKYGDLPLAQPDDAGFGHDVFEAGRKIADGMVEHAKDRLNRFRGNRTKLDELKLAEEAVTEGKVLLPVVEKYRVKDISPLTEQAKALDELTGRFAFERNRLKVLAPWRRLAEDPTDPKIAEFDQVLKQHDLQKDDEALAIIGTAKANLRKLIRTIEDVRPPVAAPEDVKSILFVAASASDKAATIPPPPPDQIPETFFAAARQQLYALDADTGRPLWAIRVGRGRGVEDVPVRIALGDAGAELVIVPTDLAGKPGITARVVRTGEVFWHQPLEAPPAARPVVVGKRVYVPIRDEAGTLVEIEATSGNRLAHLPLRQRLGAGIAHQAGTGLIYVAAEGRRVFVIDVDPHDADGNRETHALRPGALDRARRPVAAHRPDPQRAGRRRPRPAVPRSGSIGRHTGFASPGVCPADGSEGPARSGWPARSDTRDRRHPYRSRPRLVPARFRRRTRCPRLRCGQLRALRHQPGRQPGSRPLRRPRRGPAYRHEKPLARSGGLCRGG